MQATFQLQDQHSLFRCNLVQTNLFMLLNLGGLKKGFQIVRTRRAQAP
uniref:Uncharacterized protein n=1 Tax=Arundo donax TaxID=35708 RepID=A0A0A8XMW6_ARUDO